MHQIQQMQVLNTYRTILFLTFVLLASCFSEYSVVKSTKNDTHIILDLSYTGKETTYLKPKNLIIKNAQFIFRSLTYQDFEFKIIDLDNKRFEFPNYSPFPQDPQGSFSYPFAYASYKIMYTQNPFDFRIVRKQTEAILFSTFDSKIIFSNYYIEIGTQLESDYLFGLGQRLSQGFKVKNGRWSMFNRDRGDQIDTGTGLQTYGYFPFYLMREKQNNFHISYFRTSSALDAIKEQSLGKHYLNWRLIGGIINFRFFLGGNDPEQILQKLHSYYGRSLLPPFWTMGYHQSRWGYDSIQSLQNVIQNFKQNDLPLDTLWSDLDYMINNQVFTIDQSRFPLEKMKDLLDNYRWMPIIDPGIKNKGPIYEAGLQKNAYILDANTGEPFVGKMRVGRTVYPDFFHPNASFYWKEMLQNLYQKVPYSGLWLDSDEFTSFCTGRCQPPATPSKFDYGVDLPYTPGADFLQGDTISLNSTHYGNLIEADVHIFNGYLQVKESYDYLVSKNIEPFILTRSSILGSSQWSIHWSGDNVATYQFLRTSIADNFNSQLFGFQITGADICGFDQNTNPELCARWYQLGSLYPFCRNHNHRSAIDQEPYALGEPTLSAAKVNLKLRYSLLKHLYSSLAAKKGRGAFWRPLFFSFPKDDILYQDQIMDTQVMIDEQLMVTPLLQQGKSSRKVYFPVSNWYSFQEGKLYSPGYSVIQNQPNELVPIFIRERYGILTQDSTLVIQTKQLDNKFILKVGFAKDIFYSNNTDKLYRATVKTLAVSNYQNPEKHKLIREGCIYNMQVTLETTAASQILKIETKLVSGCVGDEIIINEVHLFGQDLRIVRKLREQIKILGNGTNIVELLTESILVQMM